MEPDKDAELLGRLKKIAPKKKQAGQPRNSTETETPTTSALQTGMNPTGLQPNDLAGTDQPTRAQPAALAKAHAEGRKGGRPPKEERPEADEKLLDKLQGELSKLSKKALRKLNALLDDPNARVQMQAALGTVRATVQALTRDTSTQGGGAEIHIHCTQAVAVAGPGAAGTQPQAPNPHDEISKAKRIGHPIAIVK